MSSFDSTSSRHAGGEPAAAASPAPTSARHDCFATTHWTAVVAAGRRDTPEAARALEELCQTYWYPLYAYIRRQGRTREDAEDLTQGFFERFLDGNPFAGLSADRGRFRAFLLASLKHFLANEADRAACQKRGGGWQRLSLDWDEAEERWTSRTALPAGGDSPEAAYDRAWAEALLEQVLATLEGESIADGRSLLFQQARRFLMMGEAVSSYGDTARALGMDEGAVRVAVHRLRKRYRALLRQELGRTLADPTTVDDELRALRAALVG